jgi:hypothetical protein
MSRLWTNFTIHHSPDWNAIGQIAFINSRLVRAGRALEKKA